MRAHNGKYNQYIKGSRLRRIKQKRQEIVNEKSEKMKELMDTGKIVVNKEMFKDKAPFDAEFWFRQETGLQEPNYFLPEPRDKLFVIKAIGQYEPYVLAQPDTF